MNKKTAVLINKVANVLEMKDKAVKRLWYDTPVNKRLRLRKRFVNKLKEQKAHENDVIEEDTTSTANMEVITNIKDT
jgi:hypothetical protein